MESLIAKPLAEGYTWTLTSRLGDMLNKAEETYGIRNRSFTILGIEFKANNPQIWYPGNCKHVAIQLTPDAATNMMQGCYQLAHECVHLLSPNESSQANILEEGLATFFAHKYVEEEFGNSIKSTIQSYEIARQMVWKLLTIDPYAIKALRAIESTISKITAEQILMLYPSLGATTAQALEYPFIRQHL
jgi:hypothetical protein